MESRPLGKSDWVAKPGYFVIVWGLPILALIVSAILFDEAKKIIWPVGLTWMGMGCWVNAMRCNRRHCFYTGPFFIALALASFLHGWKIFSLGLQGWDWIGWVLVLGSFALIYFPERIFGKYACKD